MRCLSERDSGSDGSGSRASEAFQDKNNHDRRGQWRYPHQFESAKPVPVATQTGPDSKIVASLSVPETATHGAEQTKWGWGARREERRKRRDETRATKVQSPENEEVQKIKEAVDKIWAERKQAAVEIQATANEKVSPSWPA